MRMLISTAVTGHGSNALTKPSAVVRHDKPGPREVDTARHCPASTAPSPSGRPTSFSRAGLFRDDDKAGTAFQADHAIWQSHDLGSRACPPSDHRNRHHAIKLT